MGSRAEDVQTVLDHLNSGDSHWNWVDVDESYAPQGGNIITWSSGGTYEITNWSTGYPQSTPGDTHKSSIVLFNNPNDLSGQGFRNTQGSTYGGGRALCITVEETETVTCPKFTLINGDVGA